MCQWKGAEKFLPIAPESREGTLNGNNGRDMRAKQASSHYNTSVCVVRWGGGRTGVGRVFALHRRRRRKRLEVPGVAVLPESRCVLPPHILADSCNALQVKK